MNDFIIKVWNIFMLILNVYFWNKIVFFLISLIIIVIYIVNIIVRENNKIRNLGYDIFFLIFFFYKIILKYMIFFLICN